MQRLTVRARQLSYDVLSGRGAWRALRTFPKERYSSLHILTERSLWSRWEGTFFRETGLARTSCVFVRRGEASKSLARVEQVASELLRRGADRHSLLVVLGGGVLGDLGGFAASTYMRGIDYVQLPTTLLAQVDSSVGGKTGVNVGAMKNLIGTFSPPRLVAADPAVLSTLALRAFRSG